MMSEFLIVGGDLFSEKDSINKFIKLLITNKPKNVLYFTTGEWDVNQTIRKVDFQVIERICVNYNIQIYVLLGGEEHENILSHKYPKENFHILRWPTYCIHEVNYGLARHYGNVENLKTEVDFNHIYDCYNHIPHHHRCVLMDELSRNDLMKYGIISWNKFDTWYNDFQFTHWDPKLMLLDEDFFIEGMRNEYSRNLLKNSGFFSVVTESTVLHMDYTEKTFRALYLEKPFLILAKEGQNQNLKKYGFETFDEIFNYDFDNDKNLNVRIEGVVNNIKSLIGKDLQEVNGVVLEKVKHNKKRIMEIEKNDEFVPIGLIELFRKYPDQFLNSDKLPIFIRDVLRRYLD